MFKELNTKKIIISATILMISLIVTSSHALEDYSGKCTDRPKLEIPQFTNKNINKYLQYQDICESQFSNELMVFLSTPTNENTAYKLSQELYKSVSEMIKYGFKPLIILEPTDYYGNDISLRELSYGVYNSFISSMFGQVRNLGITNQMIGTIVLIPEINTPMWNYDGINKRGIGKVFNQYAKSIFDVYGYAKLSIMLNNTSFEPEDTNWENPITGSLYEYVIDINKEYIYSVGLQGFPMIGPRPNSRLNINNPYDYINIDNLQEITDFLLTKKIWINTGSFVQKYRAKSRAQVINYRQLSEQVQNTSDLLFDIQQRGYEVSVNYFLFNKLNRAEETNWSLLNQEHKNIFKKIVFINSRRNIKISIFDM